MTPDPVNTRRLPGDAIAGITGVRLHPPGSEATLVNISTSGVLVESPLKLRVGAELKVQFEGGFTPPYVDGRVVRCEVAVMQRDGLLRYHIAIEFDAPVALKETAGRAPSVPRPSPAIRNRW